MWAVINGDKDICRQLIFVGADPTIKDTLKHTPLDMALNTQIRMLLKSAVEAFAEAKRDKEKREAELAAEMAARQEEEERKEREAIESAAKAIEDELRKQREAEEEVNQLKKKKKSVEVSGPVKRPSIRRMGSFSNAQKK
jgi:ankyrin repeat protein